MRRPDVGLQHLGAPPQHEHEVPQLRLHAAVPHAQVPLGARRYLDIVLEVLEEWPRLQQVLPGLGALVEDAGTDVPGLLLRLKRLQ